MWRGVEDWLHRLPLCDTPDRLGARIYLALRVDCYCCTFWRGVVLGLLVGGAITAAAFLLSR